MKRWLALKDAWTWATIPDDVFIEHAELLGMGDDARAMVKADLETP